MITLEQRQQLKKIYNALADDKSRAIYKYRLLFSLLGDKSDISDMIYEYSPDCALLQSSKICYYGAGVGATWISRCDTRAPFIIDKYKTGKMNNLPIISLDEFLKLPDCKEYLIIITVGKEQARKQIKKELDSYGLKYLFGYFDFQYFEFQYFNLPGLNLENEYFVDVGALDGETTKYFLEHFKNGYAYVFEPNPEQYKITKKNLSDYKNAECIQYGLYDENTTLNFALCETDAGSASVCKNGSLSIEVRKLDDILKDKPVTFIKMDIEGSELAALKGAENIIRTQKPKLAICVYHKPEDMWEIPSLLLEYCPDYKFYLRHYSITNTETVLYAI